MYRKSFNPFNDRLMEEPYKHSTIKDMATNDRPREKMLEKGAEALTVAELLAIIIGGGTTDKTAVELMQEIMDDCNGKLMSLSSMTVDDLKKYKGIGEAKALSIVAAAEIGRRRLQEKVSDLEPMTNGQLVFEYMQPKVLDLAQEKSWGLLLNHNARLIRCVELSVGGITDTAVDPRILMRHALSANATFIILVHNHPSGNLRPSKEDNELTKRVSEAGKIMNIKLLDHVIVSDSDYYSYSENGKL